jgi:hypothetical protein
VGKCGVHSFDSGCDLMDGCYEKCKETLSSVNTRGVSLLSDCCLLNMDCASDS